jgi:hypothetical protein
MMDTNNEAWGFFGSIRQYANADEAWTIAMEAIMEATDCEDCAIRDFLDSEYGRYFADEVANKLHDGLPLRSSIDVAITRWMTWKISRRVSVETGIPTGLPYLLGMVTDCEILGEKAQ